MKLNKLLNGVLACTMALSMGSVVSASEAPVVDAQADILIEQNEITPMMVMNEVTGDTVSVVCNSNDFPIERIQEIVNSVSICSEDERGAVDGTIQKITISTDYGKNDTSTFSQNTPESVNYTIQVEGEFTPSESLQTLASSDFKQEVKRGVQFSVRAAWNERLSTSGIVYKSVTFLTGHLSTNLNISSSFFAYENNASYNPVGSRGKGVTYFEATSDELSRLQGKVGSFVLSYGAHAEEIINSTSDSKHYIGALQFVI